jgi:hypothetical protein
MKESNLPSVLAVIQAPSVEVRDALGDLVCQIDREKVKELIDRGWARPVGRHALKYLQLYPDAPWRPHAKSWNGGSRTTQRLRAEGRLGVYHPGQALGWDKNVEHKKVYD